MLSSVSPDPTGHFKLYYYAAVLHLIDRVVQQSDPPGAIFERFPFLTGYVNELASCGLEGVSTADALPWWRTRLLEWEEQTTAFLPIRALQSAAGLTYETMLVYFCLGLGEEDARFGVLFEGMQGQPGQHHVTYGLLNAWGIGQGDDPSQTPGRALRQLLAIGLVRVINPDVPRIDWALQPTPLLWDVISGRDAAELAPDVPCVQERSARLIHHPLASLARLDALILSHDVAEHARRIPKLLAAGQVNTLVVRGPRHNGRKTLLGAIAAEIGRGVLLLPQQPSGVSHSTRDDALHSAGPLATLLNALPVLTYELAPGETAHVPPLAAYAGPVGIVAGRHGGIQATGQLLPLVVDVPARAERLAHWQRALGDLALATTMSEQFHLTSGAVYRTAELAAAWAALHDKHSIGVEDVQHATRTLNREALDTLAQPVETSGAWCDLAARNDTIDELRLLEARCRHREALAASSATPFASRTGSASTMGVRGLFTGPSGTGKTLAARILAASLGMDLYRVDLSSVVNKYIGETEKNLNELFTRAEELDVMLLIDEGDALLTQRTSVQTSNDRYANLETNFLLQRLETYSGIVIITTNAGERIDSAFQRRMDVVIEFRAPEPAERWSIWQLHLPADHRVDHGLLREVAARCSLTGGQIRNTVLHASVLALQNGGCVTSEHLETAVRREYRKSGGVYPMRAQFG